VRGICRRVKFICSSEYMRGLTYMEPILFASSRTPCGLAVQGVRLGMLRSVNQLSVVGWPRECPNML